MCTECKNKDGKLITTGTHITRLGTYKDTLGVVVECKKCGAYYLVDSFSPAIEEVNKAWIEDHSKDITPLK